MTNISVSDPAELSAEACARQIQATIGMRRRIGDNRAEQESRKIRIQLQILTNALNHRPTKDATLDRRANERGTSELGE